MDLITAKLVVAFFLVVGAPDRGGIPMGEAIVITSAATENINREIPGVRLKRAQIQKIRDRFSPFLIRNKNSNLIRYTGWLSHFKKSIIRKRTKIKTDLIQVIDLPWQSEQTGKFYNAGGFSYVCRLGRPFIPVSWSSVQLYDSNTGESRRYTNTKLIEHELDHSMGATHRDEDNPDSLNIMNTMMLLISPIPQSGMYYDDVTRKEIKTCTQRYRKRLQYKW